MTGRDADGLPSADLLQVAEDAALEPHAVLQAVRDDVGHIVDFVYREINPIGAAQHQRRREDLIGRSVAETLPSVNSSGLLARYAHCVETGEPLKLDDFTYRGQTLPGATPQPSVPQTRRYEVRAVRIAADLISLKWRDVTDLRDALDAAEEARALLRATVDAMLDPQILAEPVRDSGGRIVDFVFREVNAAACDYLGLRREELLGACLLATFPNLDGSGLLARYAHCADTGEPAVINDFRYFNEVLEDARMYDIRVTRAAVEAVSVTWRDVTERFLAAEFLAESEERYRLLADNSTDIVVHIRDGVIVWVSPSAEVDSGAPPEHWVGKSVDSIVYRDDLPLLASVLERMSQKPSVITRIRLLDVEGVAHWTEFHGRIFYDANGLPDGQTASFRVIDDIVAAEQALAEARKQQAEADALFRRAMQSAAVGTCLARTDGTFVEVNDAMCEFFGYDETTLLTKTWIELTDPDYLDADLSNIADLVAGRIDSYRMTKKYIHADGHRIWGDIYVGCLRRSDGDVQNVIGQIVDITAEVEYRDLLQSELASAAAYVRTILPEDLQGPVKTSTLYLPSSQLSGDCFNFTWIDDDHLMVYLMDVSGHGVESALVAVSVHDFLRPGSLPSGILMAPETVLTALNERFMMEHHNHHYITIWYGVYQKSTCTLTYASAGHPPPLSISGAGRPESLWAQSRPVGMFEDTTFTSQSMTVTAGSQILLYSDGSFDFPVSGGGNYGLTGFIDLVGKLSSSPDWTLQDLTEKLLSLSASGQFTDDCSLVMLTFN